MKETEPRTIELETDQATFVDELVASGQYETTADVVAAGLDALMTEDAALERWLRDDVVPIANALIDNPSRALPAKAAFAELRARYASDGPKG